MEKLLRESEEKYRTLVETSQGLIWRVDKLGRFIYLNPAWEKTHKYTIKEMLGRPFVDFQTPEQAKKDTEIFDNILKGEEYFEYETSHISKEGETVHLVFNAIVLKDKNGSVTGAQGTAYDITERKRWEEELRKFKFISDSSNDPHYLVDRDANLLYANKVACEKLGFTENELLKMTVPDVDIVFDIKKYQDLFDRVQKEKAPHFETINKRKDGSTFTSELSAMGIRLHGKPYLFAVARDITQRKRVKEKLQEAKDQAEEATKLKDQFVSLVAHDLRSPISSLLGFLNLINDDKTHPLHPQHKEMVQRILKSGNRMTQMIEELLKVSRFRLGKLALTPRFIDGYKFVKFILPQIAPLAQDKGIALLNEVPENTRLYADPQLLNEVLVNLLTNAVKFCGKGDRINVFVPTNKKTTIAVKYSGKGVAQEVLKDIFKHEVKTTTKGTKGEVGTGLGLPFCHDIIKAHGGTLEVESIVGEGSVFYANLPYVRPRVLLVDDEPNTRFMVMEFFAQDDMDFIEAENGKSALEILEKDTPHLVIVDLWMPVMDGFEFLEHIRNNPNLKTIPLIVMTGDEELETRERVFQMGGDDFITKPIKAEELIPRLRKFIC